MSRLEYSDAFIRDLDEIWVYIARDDPDAADRTVERIRATCRMLSDAPRAGRTRPELRPDIRSRTVGTYLVFYQLLEDGIEAVRVVSGHRDLPSQFSE